MDVITLEGYKAAIAHINANAAILHPYIPQSITYLKSFKLDVFSVSQVSAGVSALNYHSAARVSAVWYRPKYNGRRSSTRIGRGESALIDTG